MYPGFHLTPKCFCSTRSRTQYKRMSMALVLFCFIVPFMISYTVEFSVIISVADCGWPSSFVVALSASNYLALYNNAPHSASASDNITLEMIVDMTIIAPFGRLR